MNLNQEIPTFTGADLRLVAARYYENLEGFSGTSSDTAPPRGIAYVFASQPSFESSMRMIVSDFRDFARDDAMRPLDGAPGVRWRSANSLTAKSPYDSQPGFFTAFVPAPAKDAKTIDFTATLREFGTAGEAIEVDIDKIPVAAQG